MACRAIPRVPVIKFNNGRRCPILGLGTWKSKPGQVTQAVKDAIDIGYRHIDCAHVYQNEKEVGAALTCKMQEGIKREDLFIVSKLWNTFHRPDLVQPALCTTLKHLQLDYLDLYLIHWPHGFKEGGDLYPLDKNGTLLFSESDYVSTWKAMERCACDGLVRSIGISNFNSEQVDRILHCATIVPVTNQVECHPYLNQRKLKKFCEKRGVTITAYSPLGSPDRPWAKPGEERLLDDPKLKKIACKLNRSVAQVLIRYQLQRRNIVIPKSVTKARIQSNFEALDFKLPKYAMKKLNRFKRHERYLCEEVAKDHKDYPFNIKY